MKFFFFFVFTCFFQVTLKAQIVINEYSAANFDSFQDNYGESEDWFELYNNSGSSIDLNGYYLSDKDDNLTKWRFSSSIILDPNDYLVIYCSGRDEINGNDVHTSFKLHQTKGNEWIILTSPDGLTIVDSVFVKPCLTNSSRGLLATNSMGIFTNPSPNSVNTDGFINYANKPSFSLTPGIYNNAINVSIESDPGTTIYYTTDGSFPDNTDNQYTGPINITNTTVLKAVAYSNNPQVLASFIQYGTYFIDINHSMKILSVSGDLLTDLIENGNQIEPIGTIELYESDGSLIDKAKGEFNEHGNDSWAYDQRGFDYITRDQFGYNYAIKGQLFNNKDRNKYQRLILKCAANDNYPFSYGSSGAHIRDAYVQSLSQVANLKLDERSYEPCILYLNGNYWGLYEIREKVDDLDFTEYYYDQDSVEFLKTWGGTWVDVLVDGQDPADVQVSWNDMRTFITSNDMTDADNYNFVKSQFNTASLIDYYLLNSYVVNADWLNWNTAWWHGLNEDGNKKKWRYVLWDMDNTFEHGANYTGIPNTNTNANVCDAESLGDIGGQGHIPIWNALIQNDDFFNDYINRWSNLSNSYLSCEFMTHHLDSLINRIEPEMQAQINRWGGTYEEWSNNVQTLSDFMLERCDSLNSSIVDCYDVQGPYNLSIIIEGEGQIDFNNFFEIDENTTPFNGSFFGGVNLHFEVLSGNFINYEIISDSLYNYTPSDDDFDLQLNSDLTIIFYFDPNQITFLVDPPLSGSIIIDGNTISNFPHTIDYLNTQNSSFEAIPNAGWEMGYWESNHHFIIPTTTQQNVELYAHTDDTITLNLAQKIVDITFVAFPTDANIELEVNNQLISTFPYTINPLYGNTLNLIISTDSSWSFLYFDSYFGSLTSQSSYPTQSIQALQSDTIYLYFEPVIFHPISFDISPPNSGYIYVDNTFKLTEFITKEYETNKLISLAAEANEGWAFSHWSATNHLLSPEPMTPFVSLAVEQQDQVVAHFTEAFNVYVPNSFTPNNGDNKHNTFEVFVNEGLEIDFSIKIFNRFGQCMFESQDINKSWDGTFKKQDVQNGIYTYILQVTSINSGNTIIKKGNITLIR